MTLIKIGDQYINMDNVIVADWGSEPPYMALTTADQDEIVLEGDEAAALRAWLDWRAADVLREYEAREGQDEQDK